MKIRNLIIIAIFIIFVCLSFFAGNYFSNKENIKNREQTCKTMIVFAINKLENLQQQYESDEMEALISNIYAAYAYCDNDELASALHDLWNALVFDGENIVGKENDLIKALKDTNSTSIKEISINIRTKNFIK